MTKQRPEAIRFLSVSRAWETAGMPQTGPLFEKMERTRQEFLESAQADVPTDKESEVKAMGPKIGPGPGPR